MKKAVVLLSGGVDSAVTLYIAKKDRECQALIFDYGQKASREITSARNIAEKAGCEYKVLNIPLLLEGSSLLDRTKSVPEGFVSGESGIPDTYVPARNMIFLSFAVSFAEAAGADAVFIGAHQMDFSNYPDCRDEFFVSFQEMIRKGTKMGVEGREIRVITPVIDMTKREIVEAGRQLGVPFEHTWSCYAGGHAHCGKCESCLFRQQAFEDAGIEDPLMRKV